MARVIILLLDSFGVGAAPDAAQFGDAGADTLGHIADWCATQRQTADGAPQYLALPQLNRLGLGRVATLSRGTQLVHPLGPATAPLAAAAGFAHPVSLGKDTLSGHWELTGVPVQFAWGYFPDIPHCFPPELVSSLLEAGNLPGILGETHASGTAIIRTLGEEHCRTGKPIVYTSGDSVLQIAAHEETFGLERLYDLCKIAFQLVQPYHIARVIARPFVGTSASTYVRTGNRHDFAVPAPADTLLDRVVLAGGQVLAVGKIADIFAHRGISKHFPATGLAALFDATLAAVHEAPARSVVFTNFVDFDSSYGHRRDTGGYAQGLEYFDSRWPELERLLQPEDLVLLTADHGCDPTWQGSDHTRENIPVLFVGQQVKPQLLPPLTTFADAGQTLAAHLGLQLQHGQVQNIFKQ
ncbi:MAG: phosphopentomutase [Acidaminococcaceae bacterium]